MEAAVRGRASSWGGVGGGIAVGGLVALAGSGGSVLWRGVPLLAVCVCVAYAIQWVAFVPAYLRQTERFFDLVGSLTFLTVVGLAVSVSGTSSAAPTASGPVAVDLRAGIIASCVAVWALRLGAFLAVRVHRGGDSRFDRIKPDVVRFLMTWTLQGAWVTVSLGPGLVAMTAAERAPADGFLLAGTLLWLLGFGIEVVADEQKRRFRSKPENAGRFIGRGLWALSRHPNYFGEIVLWTGLAVAALPVLSGWSYATLASPVFIWLLLTKVSGVPMLEAAGRERWGDDPAYRDYLARTPLLLPIPFLRR